MRSHHATSNEMLRSRRTTRCFLPSAAAMVFLGLLLGSLPGRAGAASGADRGVFQRFPGGVTYLPVGADSRMTPPPAVPQRANYASLISFQMTDQFFAPWDEPARTTIFSGNYPANTITQHVVDSHLNHTQGPLSMTYGLAWLVQDLDGDGNVEMVVQRGDTGMGGNGYLDIHSAPNWVLRTRIVLPDMKVVFYPQAINVDGDPELELFLSPGSLGGYTRVYLVDYNPVTWSFYVRYNLPASGGTYGPAAAGDFDHDGRTEFLIGHHTGYDLYECGPGGLSLIGLIPDTEDGAWGTAVRPEPDGVLRALLGHSSFDLGFKYRLLRATGDNTFVTEKIFQEITGWSGIHPAYPLDADADGLQEFVLGLYPNARVFDWNTTLGDFENVWSWDQTLTGTFAAYDDCDLDKDGLREWCMVNHLNVFSAYEDQHAAAVTEGAMVGSSGCAILSRPNPFASDLRISCDAPRGAGGSGLLSLYSPSGARLRTWEIPPGAKACLSWNGLDGSGRQLPAGVYLLRLDAGDQTSTCRVVRVR
jgi:hypothetical protein